MVDVVMVILYILVAPYTWHMHTMHTGWTTITGSNGNALRKIKRKTFFLKKMETLSVISERFQLFLRKKILLIFPSEAIQGQQLNIKHLENTPLYINNTTITTQNYYKVSSKEMYMIIQPVIPQLWPLLISNYSYHQ